MAIVQISRIQHRRGLAENLPQLSHAELGWVTDTRELYIGNGPLSAGAPVVGNTAILTEHSDLAGLFNYTYEGNADLVVRTSDNISSPIIRSLQDRLDDYVSVMDFGAVGDGIVDDSDAINRAMYELFIRDTTQKARRSLYFPAGVYKTTEVIDVPTWATLYGDGSGKTIIQYNEVQTTATATANLSAGEVVSLSLVSGGSGYTTPPVVVITTTSGDGNAAFTANLTEGVVTSLTQVAPGAGYSDATVTIVSTKTAGHDSCVFRIVDSKGQAAPNIGNNSAIQPQNIFIKGMTIKTLDTEPVLQDCIQVESTLNSYFEDVAFVGTYTGGALAGNDRPAGVKVAQTLALVTRNLVFRGCSFQGLPVGFYCTETSGNDAIEGVSFIGCNFDLNFKGIWLGDASVSPFSGTGPRSFHISGCLFNNIYSSAIDVDRAEGIYSIHNTFTDCANLGFADNTGNASSAVIDYAVGIDNCSSISDKFGRPDNDGPGSTDIPRVDTNNGASYVVVSNKKETFGRREHIIADQITLTDNQTGVTTGLDFAESDVKYVRINYKIERSTNSRTGTLSIAITSGASTVSDDYSETAVLGVSLAVTHSGGVATLEYTTTSTGLNATMTYYIEYLN